MLIWLYFANSNTQFPFPEPFRRIALNANKEKRDVYAARLEHLSLYKVVFTNTNITLSQLVSNLTFILVNSESIITDHKYIRMFHSPFPEPFCVRKFLFYLFFVPMVT